MIEKYTNEELKKALITSETTQNKALRWIYQQEKWRKSVDKMVFGMGGNITQSADVFQEGIAVFARKIMQGKFNEESSLFTFFIGICKNCSLRKIKKKNMTNISKREEIKMYNPEAKLIEKECSEELEKMMHYLLGQLKEKCRKILKMYSLKYPMEEIASEMGFKKEQSAKNAAFKCRKKLRNLIVSDKKIYQKIQECL